MWKINAPPRCNLTLWLALNNKLLTMENIIKRGWNGPNWCSLCKASSETISHMFIHCSYATQVFHSVKEKLQAKTDWNKPSLEECVKDWLLDRSVNLYASLPSILVNNLWWAHNSNIHKDRLVPPEVTTTLTVGKTMEFMKKQKTKTQRSLCSLK
jgi:hypothetical protein